MAKFRNVLAALLVLVFSGHLYADSGDAYLDELSFKVMVIGASDEIFIWWGHAALIVENARFGSSTVYDWGIFSYPSDSFLFDWIRNRVSYKCAAAPAKPDIESYSAEDRDIVVYTLNLEADRKQAILDYAQNKVLPENCYYVYHPFNDNCATSIRDLIDMGTRGQLKQAFIDAPGRLSFRQHLRRFTWFRNFSDNFFSFLMGQDLDRETSVWEEMFLPVEIGRNISGFAYIDGLGNERQLVSRVELINATKGRKPVLDAPLGQWPAALSLALAVSVFLASIILLRKKFPVPGRIAWGLAQSAAGLALGLSGSVLFFVMFFMKHDYFRNNFNLIYINPLLLAAVPLGIAAAAGKSGAEKILRHIWSSVFVLDLLLLLLRVFPFFFQQSQALQMVLFPLAFLLAWDFETNKAGLGNNCRRISSERKEGN